MTEPVSTLSAGGLLAIMKAFGMTIVVIIFVLLVSAVVFMTRMPRTPQEWAVGLICTVVSSLGGGSFVISKFHLHQWGADAYGMMAIGGIFFACGLPGWALVRWTTTFILKREGKDILEVANELRDFKNQKGGRNE